jgi:transcriptional regulator with XRE-family HTH domain
MASGLTQEELADRSGVSVRAIRDMERGQTGRPYRRSLQALAAAMELDATETARLIRDVYALSVPGGDLPEISHSIGGRAEAPSLPLLAQLPSAPAHFVDRRDAMAKLDGFLDAALDGGAGGSVALVVGAAGVGKTALVTHWGHRVADRFPDGILYVDLHGYSPTAPMDPRQALNWFLRALGWRDREIPSALGECSALYRSVLANRRVLVVLDNAATAEQVRPLLTANRGCAVTVTSRQALTGLVVREGAQRVHLAGLPEGDAVRLLGLVAGEHRVAAEPAAAADLVHRCGHLPLAIRVMGQRLRGRPHRTLGATAEELASQDSWLDALDTLDDPTSSIRTLLSWSYRSLPGLTAHVFRELSACTSDVFSVEDAERIFAVNGAAIPSSHIADALGRLAETHLLDDVAPNRYRFNAIVRCFARERRTEEARH